MTAMENGRQSRTTQITTRIGFLGRNAILCRASRRTGVKKMGVQKPDVHRLNTKELQRFPDGGDARIQEHDEGINGGRRVEHVQVDVENSLPLEPAAHDHKERDGIQDFIRVL